MFDGQYALARLTRDLCFPDERVLADVARIVNSLDPTKKDPFPRLAPAYFPKSNGFNPFALSE